MQFKKIKTINELVKKAQENRDISIILISKLVELVNKYDIRPTEDEKETPGEEQGHLIYEAPTNYDEARKILNDLALHYQKETPVILEKFEFLDKTRILKALPYKESWDIDDKNEWLGLLGKLEAIFLEQV